MKPLKRKTRIRKWRSVKGKKPVKKLQRSKVSKKISPRRPTKNKKGPGSLKKGTPLPKKNQPQEVLVGEITHFFSKIRVVVIKMTSGQIEVGNRIHIKGKSSDFIQTIKSLQIESVDVNAVSKGQLAGLKVDRRAKEGDKVYRLYK